MATEQTPPLSAYTASIKRRWRIMSIVGVPVAVIGLLVAVAMPSLYLAPATFQFDTPAIAERGGGQRDLVNYEDEYVSKLTDAVLTTEALTRMRQALNVYPQLGADEREAAAKIAKNVKVVMVTERILDPESGRQKDVNSGFTVAFQSRTPEEAQQAGQWLTDRFITVSREMRRDKALHTAAFIASEAERYRGQIAQLESKVADFKSKHYEELPESAQANLQNRERLEQDANSIDHDIRTLEQNRVFLEMQLQQALANSGDNEVLTQLEEEYRRKAAVYDQNHPDMVALRKRMDAARRAGASRASDPLKAQLETQKSILLEARQRYSEDHPDVKRLEREIAHLEARIAAGEKSDTSLGPPNPVVVQLQTQLRGTDNQIASLRLRNAELRDKLARITGHLGSSPQVEKDYQVLSRDLTLARDKYDQLLKQKMDAEFSAAASMAGSGDEFRLTGPPSLPTAPGKPSRVAIGLIGIILALLLALMAGLGAEATDPTIRGSRDVMAVLDISPLAIVPEIRNSVSHARRLRQATILIASTVVAVPALYFLINFAVR